MVLCLNAVSLTRSAQRSHKRPAMDLPLFSERHRLGSDKVLASSPLRGASKTLAVSPESLEQFQSWEQTTFQQEHPEKAPAPRSRWELPLHL